MAEKARTFGDCVSEGVVGKYFRYQGSAAHLYLVEEVNIYGTIGKLFNSGRHEQLYVPFGDIMKSKMATPEEIARVTGASLDSLADFDFYKLDRPLEHREPFALPKEDSPTMHKGPSPRPISDFPKLGEQPIINGPCRMHTEDLIMGEVKCPPTEKPTPSQDLHGYRRKHPVRERDGHIFRKD